MLSDTSNFDRKSQNGRGQFSTGKLGLRPIKPQNGATPAKSDQSAPEAPATELSSTKDQGTAMLSQVDPILEAENEAKNLTEDAPVSLAGLIPDLETLVPGSEDAPGSLSKMLSRIEAQHEVVPDEASASVSLASLIPDLVTNPVVSAPLTDENLEAKAATVVPQAEPVAHPTPEREAPVAVTQVEEAKPASKVPAKIEVETNVVTPLAPVQPPLVAQPVVQATLVAPAQPTVQAAPPPTQQIIPAAQPIVQYTPASESRPKPIPIKKTMPTKFVAPVTEPTEIVETEKSKGKAKKKRTLHADFDRVKLDYQFHRIVQQLEVQPSLETPLLVGVTSTLRGEGRTTVAMGLASAISQEIPLPVILIEADLTNPNLAEDLGVDQPGLSEYLRGDIELDDLIQSTSLADLAVIVGGDCKGQALKLLRSERLSDLIHSLSYQFAAIVVDLPPMSMTGEAARVINQLDRVLMVVEAGSTPNRLVKTALELIPEEKIMGVLLNRTRPAFGFFQWVKRLFR